LEHLVVAVAVLEVASVVAVEVLVVASVVAVAVVPSN
jgi:hypothetical protein